MSKDNKEYEEAATQLVDLEDFRKYMAEEEEAQRAAEEATDEPAPAVSEPAGAPKTEFVQPQSQAPMESGDAKSIMLLGVISLIPGLGILLGPAAIMKAGKEKKAIEAGHISAGSLQQVQMGLYLGVVGLLLSLGAIGYFAMSSMG